MIGEICALAAAFTWAFAMVLFKRSVEDVSPLALNLFKNVVALTLFAVTLAVLPDGSQVLRHHTLRDFAILAASGIIGIALADTVFFRSLDLVGVGITSIVDCLYSPFVILFAALLLSERLAPHQYLGMTMVVSAVFLSSRHAPPPNRTAGQITWGVFLGTLAIALNAFGIVIAKPVLDGRNFPLLWAASIRMVAGVAVLIGLTFLRPSRRRIWSVFRPGPIWKVSLPASFLGAYLAMILWVAGFKYAKAAVAGILNQTSVIFAMILATVILKESLTLRKVVALVVAAVGVVVVTM